jgi:hypothetical protein
MARLAMQDKDGNELTYYNGLWWSTNFDRFWKLVSARNGMPVMICRLYPGMNPKFIYPKGVVSRRYWWNKWVRYGWAFFDPQNQLIYPGERTVNDNTERCFDK